MEHQEDMNPSKIERQRRTQLLRMKRLRQNEKTITSTGENIFNKKYFKFILNRFSLLNS